MNKNFTKAVRQSGNQRKTTIVGNCINSTTGISCFVDKMIFYKFDEILDENEIVISVSLRTNLFSDPTIQIPIPAVRRIEKFDGKFFLMKSGGTCFDLYCPYYYFFFEKDEITKEKGFQNYVYDRKTSKLDRSLEWVADEPKEITEDPEKKSKLLDLYAERASLNKKIDQITGQLNVLDPSRIVQDEYEAVMDKMFKSIEGTDTSGGAM